jgi:hypothetical protein
MPRKSSDYSRTVIYKLVCNDIAVKDFYVGHTTGFSNRKWVHKNDCNNPNKNKNKIYTIINENGGWDNWKMVEIEKFSCKDGNEARAREKHFADLLQPTMNTIETKFISWDGLTCDDIVGKDAKETNILKTRWRRDKLMEEIVVLRKENAELKKQLLSRVLN